MNLGRFKVGQKVTHVEYGECTVDEIQNASFDFEGGWTLTIDTEEAREQYARDRGGSLPGKALPRLFEGNSYKLTLIE